MNNIIQLPLTGVAPAEIAGVFLIEAYDGDGNLKEFEIIAFNELRAEALAREYCHVKQWDFDAITYKGLKDENY